MKRYVKSEKVMRAMALGVASMLAITSTPIKVYADDTESGIQPGELTPPVADYGKQEDSSLQPETIADIAAARGEGADNYAGALESPTQEATGTIGTKTQEALDHIDNAQQADSADNALYDTSSESEKALDKLLDDGKPGSGGQAQIKKAEGNEAAQEGAFGVKTNEKGEIVDQGGLEAKVSGANDAIGVAEAAKEEAYEALAGNDGNGGAKKAIETASSDYSDATSKKQTADNDTTTAQTEAAKKTAIDKETQAALDAVAETLEKAVDEKNIAGAIESVKNASADAVTIAGEQLVIAESALQNAKNAADDAEGHSASYTYQQMSSLALTAQQAANTAQQAANDAQKAADTALTKEQEAEKAVKAAETALKQAEDDAAKELEKYKEKIKAINKFIETANDSREDARDAIKKANASIDEAMKLMQDNSDPTVQSVSAKVDAMNEAINKANEAIKKVTGLVYDENATKEEKEQNAFYKAEKSRKDANTRLQNEIQKLNEAKATYDEAIKATGTANANKEAAEAIVAEIDKLINGIEGEYVSLYDRWEKDTEYDILDIAAKKTSDGKSYRELEDTADKAQEDLAEANGALTNAYKEYIKNDDGSWDKNLTADQVAALYEQANNKQPDLDKASDDLEKEIGKQQGIYDQCNADFSTVKGRCDSAVSMLTTDEAALGDKYVYSYNVETKEYVIETDTDGDPVYSETYKKLLKDSEERSEDIVEYKNGDDVLDISKADYKEADGTAIYTKGKQQTTSEIRKGDSKPGRMPDDFATVVSVYKRVEGDSLIVENNCKYSYPQGWRVNNTNAESAKGDGTIVMYDHADDEEFIIQNIITEKCEQVFGISLGEEGTVEVSGNTATVKVRNPDAKDSDGNPAEGWIEYVFNTDIKLNGQYYTKVSYTVNSFTMESVALTGSYVEIFKYDYTKYDRKVTPGEYTQNALDAQKEKAKIDASAKTAMEQIKGHLAEKEDAALAWDKLNDDMGAAYTALYGDENTMGLIKKKEEADAAKKKNQNFIDSLKSTAEGYKNAGETKSNADKAIEEAKKFVNSEDPDILKAVAARQQILDSKGTANGYLAQAQEGLTNLKADLLADTKDGIAKYDEVIKKVEAATGRLTTVEKKLIALKNAQIEAKNNLLVLEEDGKLKLEDGTVIDLVELNAELDKELGNLNKYDPEKYADLELFALDELSVDSLSKKLAAAINKAAGILEDKQAELKEIAETRKEAQKKADDIRKLAEQAQAEADRAARALANWRAPVNEEETTGNVGGGVMYYSAGESSSDAIPVSGSSASRVVANTATPQVVGSVLGAVRSKNTNSKTDKADEKDNIKQTGATGNTSGKGSDKGISEDNTASETTKNVTIIEPSTPLSATPFEDKKGLGVIWLYGLFSAAVAGASGAVAYISSRRKNFRDNNKKK